MPITGENNLADPAIQLVMQRHPAQLRRPMAVRVT